jgi:hypothetical protein
MYLEHYSSVLLFPFSPLINSAVGLEGPKLSYLSVIVCLGITQKLIHIFRWTNRVVPGWSLCVML